MQLALRQQSVLLALLLIFAYILFKTALAWGIGISVDSIVYIKQATLLHEHFSYRNISPHWPPAYSLTIYLLGFLPGDIFSALDHFHSFVYLSNVLIVYLLLHKMFPGRPGAALLSALAFAVVNGLFRAYVYALTESVFTLFLLLNIYLTWLFADGRQARHLVLAGICLGIAATYRYAAAPLVPVSIAYMIYLNWKNGGQQKTALYALACIALPALVFIMNKLVHDSSSNRELTLHWMNLQHWLAFLKFLPSQLFPSGIGWISLLLFLPVLYLIFSLVRNHDRNNFTAYLVLQILGYQAFVVLSITLVDAHIIPDMYRVLLPSLVIVLLVFFLAVATLPLSETSGKIAMASLACLLVFQLIPLSGFINEALSKGGFGFRQQSIQTQPLMQKDALAHYSGKELYSNSPELLFLYHRLEAEHLPYLYNPSTLVANPSAEREYQEILQKVQNKEAAVIYLRAMSFRQYFPTENQLMQYLPGPIYHDYDGMIVE